MVDLEHASSSAVVCFSKSLLFVSGETGWDQHLGRIAFGLTGMEWSDVCLELLREMTQLGLRGGHRVLLRHQMFRLVFMLSIITNSSY